MLHEPHERRTENLWVIKHIWNNRSFYQCLIKILTTKSYFNLAPKQNSFNDTNCTICRGLIDHSLEPTNYSTSQQINRQRPKRSRDYVFESLPLNLSESQHQANRIPKTVNGIFTKPNADDNRLNKDVRSNERQSAADSISCDTAELSVFKSPNNVYKLTKNSTLNSRSTLMNNRNIQQIKSYFNEYNSLNDINEISEIEKVNLTSQSVDISDLNSVDLRTINAHAEKKRKIESEVSDLCFVTRSRKRTLYNRNDSINDTLVNVNLKWNQQKFLAWNDVL